MMNWLQRLKSGEEINLSDNTLDLPQVFQLAEQIFGILWSFMYFFSIEYSEISGDALAVGLELIPSLLMLFKKTTGAPQLTREVIGQVILLCVDENSPSIPICDEMRAVLDDSSEDMSTKILAASILSYSNDYFYSVLPILSSCIDGDWESWMKQAQELAINSVNVLLFYLF